MDADWYVDPQGTYDGRYFDGDAWTNQVSANGELATDPNWPPVEQAANDVVSDADGLPPSPVDDFLAELDELTVESEDRLDVENQAASLPSLSSVDSRHDKASVNVAAELSSVLDEGPSVDGVLAQIDALEEPELPELYPEAASESAELVPDEPMPETDVAMEQVPAEVERALEETAPPEQEIGGDDLVEPTDNVSKSMPELAPIPPMPQAPGLDPHEVGPEAPAVKPFEPPGPLTADLAVESPGRVVAVLGEDPPATDSAAARGDVVEVAANADEAATHVDEAPIEDATEPALPAAAAVQRQATTSRRGQWLFWILGFFLLFVLAFLAANALLNSDSDDASPDDATAIDSSTARVFDPAASFDIGDITLVNGVTVLENLAEWHRGDADARGVFLDEGSACWFGSLADTMVPNAFCGPVGGSADTEYQFDKVPLTFDNDASGGQIVQAIREAVTRDQVVSNNVDLVGPVDPPA